jgi:HK97 gp10 family phage protein
MGKAKITVSIEGDQELKRKLERLGTRAQAALGKAGQAGANPIKETANQMAPGPYIVTSEPVVNEGKVTVDIGPDQDHWYYQFLELGAKPHEIKGNPLVFKGRRGKVITLSVQHPGIEPRPFLRPALTQQKNSARDAAGNVFRKEIDALTGGG